MGNTYLDMLQNMAEQLDSGQLSPTAPGQGLGVSAKVPQWGKILAEAQRTKRIRRASGPQHSQSLSLADMSKGWHPQRHDETDEEYIASMERVQNRFHPQHEDENEPKRAEWRRARGLDPSPATD